MSIEPDASLCPLCGHRNHCVMADDTFSELAVDQSRADSSAKSSNLANECWCMSVSFPDNYSDLLSEKDIDTRCLCPACHKKLSEAP
jgi:hypothetical protein